MPDTPLLVIATRNAHKTAEIRAMIGDRFEVLDATAFPELPEIEETGTTFLENARLKAEGISRLVDGWVLSDDSGLEVDALDGAPGVWSSSFGGEEGNHALNNRRLMREMEGKDDRAARFPLHHGAGEGRPGAGEFHRARWRGGSSTKCGEPRASGMIRCLCRRVMTRPSASWEPR